MVVFKSFCVKSTYFKRTILTYYNVYSFIIKQITPNDQTIISHMFHSSVENIKKEEVKLQPTNMSDFSHFSSGMSFSSGGNYPSLDELCISQAESSDRISTLPYIIEFVCNKKII